MILTIVRHGEAGQAASDRLRALTRQGEKDVVRAGKALHAACERYGLPAPGRLHYSPWLRTDQTATLLSQRFPAAQSEMSDWLRPAASLASVDKQILALNQQNAGNVHEIIVTHQPLASRLVDLYLGSQHEVAGLTPGGFATVALQVAAAGVGRLVCWGVPPEYGAGNSGT
ncbi:MAG: hypothetical protein AAGA91_11935 [Pseudomonadota bacterium]